MPYRKTPFVPQEIYHVFNRSIASFPIFTNKREYQRMFEIVNYYRFEKPPLRFSHYNRLPREQKELVDKQLKEKKPFLNIFSYCFMPNHVHFLLQPIAENAISDFMRNIQNSYSKYFNLKHQRNGSLFQFMFKALRIETDEQLLHVSRYIHLNPVTSYIINIDDLEKYDWSSFKYYLSNENNSFVSSDFVLSFFKSKDKYKEFVFDQVGYQRELNKIKHLTME